MAFLALVAVPAEAQPNNLANKPAGVVAALADKQPRVLSELEAVVGPLRRDPAKWEEAVGPLRRISPGPAVARAHVDLGIDIFHQDPRKVEDPSLGHWELDFTSGRDASRRLLAGRFPKAAELRGDDGRRVLRFGDLYFSELDVDGGFRLSWYCNEPLFAIPQRNEQETAKLVAGLAAVANAGFTRQAIAAHLGPLAYDPQRGLDVLRTGTWTLDYKPTGAARPERIAIDFKRPLPARDLLPRLGIQRPGVISGDTHMQSRTVIDLAKRFSPEIGHLLPAVKDYGIRISVDQEGLIKTGEKRPGTPIWSAEGAQILSLSAYLHAPPE